MFPLRERSRRQVMLAAFGLVCVVPTATVLLCGAARHWPGQPRSEARRLSEQLGVEVAIDGFRHLRPGVVLYEDLSLTDPETGQPLLRCRVLQAEWSRARDAEGRRRPSLLLIASQPQVQADGLERLWQLMRRPLYREHAAGDVEIRLLAGELTVQRKDRAETLSDVQASIESLPGGSEAQLSFRLAGAEASEPARVRVVRNRRTAPPTNGFEFDTGGGALPCSLIALALPELSGLGSRCSFRGYVAANQTSDGPAPGAWSGQMVGNLAEVDLGTLIGDRFPHKLSGSAEVAIQRAAFRNGRLEECTTVVRGGPGVVGRSLLNAAAERLSLAPGAAAAAARDLLLYDRMAFAALLDSSGLRLQGRCPATEPGTILAAGGQRLLGEPAVQPQPVVRLIQAMVPASEHQVPATRQTDWLIRHLPVPRVQPPPGSEPVAPHAQLRLKDDAVR